MKSSGQLQFVIESEEESDVSLSKTLNDANDTIPEQFSALGEVTIKIMDKSNVIHSMKTNFKVGGNYQILVQYRDDGIFNVSIYIFFWSSKNVTLIKHLFRRICHFNASNYSLQEPIIVDEITLPNKISTFWQLPQIMLITAGEIMFSITGLKFAFSQVKYLA